MNVVNSERERNRERESNFMDGSSYFIFSKDSAHKDDEKKKKRCIMFRL